MIYIYSYSYIILTKIISVLILSVYATILEIIVLVYGGNQGIGGWEKDEVSIGELSSRVTQILSAFFSY